MDFQLLHDKHHDRAAPTQLDPNVKEKLNACLIKLNSILLQYNIKTFEDYNQITKVHLDKMIETLKKICLILKNNF
jgi:hypothetical protein